MSTRHCRIKAENYDAAQRAFHIFVYKRLATVLALHPKEGEEMAVVGAVHHGAIAGCHGGPFFGLPRGVSAG